MTSCEGVRIDFYDEPQICKESKQHIPVPLQGLGNLTLANNRLGNQTLGWLP